MIKRFRARNTTTKKWNGKYLLRGRVERNECAGSKEGWGGAWDIGLGVQETKSEGGYGGKKGGD